MEVNRIKWDEEMNKRCMERVRYLSPKGANPAQKRGNALELPYGVRPPMDSAEDGIRAFGIGELMECKWLTD